MLALIRHVMPRAGTRAEVFAPHIESACAQFGITAPLSVAMFLAQLAHESGELRHVRELASGDAYEGRADLGNTEPGDGPRFRGRGLIQLTGRANYVRCGKALGLDLVAQPELLEEPRWAAWSAAWFWREHGLDELAAGPDALVRCTRRINGGLNGLADRGRYYTRALAALKLMKEGAMPVPAFLAAALTSLLPMVPELIRSFGSDGSKMAERNARAAEIIVEAAKTATGATTEQEAVQRIESDPAAREAFTTAVRQQWYDIVDAGGGGVEGAREFAKASLTRGDEFWRMGVFWVTLALLPLLYGTVYLVLTGSAEAFSGELRAAIASSVVTGVLGGIIGFWLGLKFSAPKSDVLSMRA